MGRTHSYPALLWVSKRWGNGPVDDSIIPEPYMLSRFTSAYRLPPLTDGFRKVLP